jgi:hypothetical protein
MFASGATYAAVGNSLRSLIQDCLACYLALSGRLFPTFWPIIPHSLASFFPLSVLPISHCLAGHSPLSGQFSSHLPSHTQDCSCHDEWKIAPEFLPWLPTHTQICSCHDNARQLRMSPASQCMKLSFWLLCLVVSVNGMEPCVAGPRYDGSCNILGPVPPRCSPQHTGKVQSLLSPRYGISRSKNNRAYGKNTVSGRTLKTCTVCTLKQQQTQ